MTYEQTSLNMCIYNIELFTGAPAAAESTGREVTMTGSGRPSIFWSISHYLKLFIMRTRPLGLIMLGILLHLQCDGLDIVEFEQIIEDGQS